MKLSIIIPVYNVEKYIDDCLKSCYNQDLPSNEYEIIVVNDGTTDRSMDIVTEYVNTHINIVIVNQDNKGLSCARNTGVKAARGEYILFIDSDDTIVPNCLSLLIKTASLKKLDILCFNCFIVDEKQENPSPMMIPHEKSGVVYDGEEFICKVKMPHPAWLALYRKDFLIGKRLSFVEKIYFEDQEFTPRAYYLADSISYINMPLYCYRQRPGSIMKGDSQQRKKKAKDMLTVADSLHLFMKNYMKKGTPAYDVMLYNVAFAFSQSLKFYEKSYFPIQKYKERTYYPFDLRSIGGSKLKYRLMNFSLDLYLFILKIRSLW